MTASDCDVLRVDVPVGYLLSDSREILVSVDRANEAPLKIRLRLIAAEAEGLADLGATPRRSPHDTPLPIRRLARKSEDEYPHDFGGSD